MTTPKQGAIPEWITARIAFEKKACELLGEHIARLVIREGKFFDAGELSGRYFDGLLNDPSMLPTLEGYLLRLAQGEAVPIMLMHRYYPSRRIAHLQLTSGILEMVYLDGQRKRV